MITCTKTIRDYLELETHKLQCWDIFHLKYWAHQPVCSPRLHVATAFWDQKINWKVSRTICNFKSKSTLSPTFQIWLRRWMHWIPRFLVHLPRKLEMITCPVSWIMESAVQFCLAALTRELQALFQSKLNHNNKYSSSTRTCLVMSNHRQEAIPRNSRPLQC